MIKGIYDRVKCKVLYLLPRGIAHKCQYYLRLGKRLDLDDPFDFNEKIQFLIVNKYGEKEGAFADKERVKKYVKELKIKGLAIPKTIMTYNDPADIDLSKLPDQFVLKCNHSSGGVFVCNDKNDFNLEEARRVLGKKLKENYAKKTLEYHYSSIKPLIMAEEYLDDGARKNPLDYKFYVFNGKCDRIYVCSERDKKLKRDQFDRNWKHLDDVLPEYRPKKEAKKPKNLKKMIRIAEELCKKDGRVVIPFARIDLYNINGKIYFGEYTFTPASGMMFFYTQRALNELGRMLDLTKYD